MPGTCDVESHRRLIAPTVISTAVYSRPARLPWTGWGRRGAAVPPSTGGNRAPPHEEQRDHNRGHHDEAHGNALPGQRTQCDPHGNSDGPDTPASPDHCGGMAPCAERDPAHDQSSHKRPRGIEKTGEGDSFAMARPPNRDENEDQSEICHSGKKDGGARARHTHRVIGEPRGEFLTIAIQSALNETDTPTSGGRRTRRRYQKQRS